VQLFVNLKGERRKTLVESKENKIEMNTGRKVTKKLKRTRRMKKITINKDMRMQIGMINKNSNMYRMRYECNERKMKTKVRLVLSLGRNWTFRIID
jgi:hypothetical protein